MKISSNMQRHPSFCMAHNINYNSFKSYGENVVKPLKSIEPELLKYPQDLEISIYSNKGPTGVYPRVIVALASFPEKSKSKIGRLLDSFFGQSPTKLAAKEVLMNRGVDLRWGLEPSSVLNEVEFLYKKFFADLVKNK